MKNIFCDYKDMKVDEISLHVANDFVVKLVYGLSNRYKITIGEVMQLFTEINYWRIVNDTEVCCVLAEEGLKNTIEKLEGDFDVILSRYTRKF